MAYAIMNGMTVKIDKAGRIVLPKPVRERFQLREGSELVIEEGSDGLTLKPVETTVFYGPREGHVGSSRQGASRL